MPDLTISAHQDQASAYPATNVKRNEWIEARRPDRALLDPHRPYAFLVEDECSASGEIVPVATMFLTNRECPWRCVMCDLWRNTLTDPVPAGAIPSQIEYALARLPAARHIKLYNSGSFFDPRAIPREDYDAIAALIKQFERVIVECHPSLVGEACLRFRDLFDGRLEIAMGLETAHPETLERLNKRMTLDLFASAARFLNENEIDLRVFILVQPPFMKVEEALHWAERSLDFAFDSGATAATLIPTRGGNGAMESLKASGDFTPPGIKLLETALQYGLQLDKGRVFADTWDLARQSSDCALCFADRVARLKQVSLCQSVLPEVICGLCDSAV